MLYFFHTLAVRDKEQREKLDTYQRMIGARDVEINALSSKLSTVQKHNDAFQRMIGARDVEIDAISSRLATVKKQNEELESKL